MPIVHHKDIPLEDFSGGSTYQTLVGDKAGSTPVRIGIQTSPPGYSARPHSHPYTEILTVLEGRAEAWMEGVAGTIIAEPGMTLVFPPNQKHGFTVIGAGPFRTYGVHASAHRIVDFHDQR
ncbi:MAG: cupin domain-containing protein [Alphaproteobacteria bacterium]|nr:cupin domain-containing protein [Alphaproteobacteria bacterium]